MPTNAAFDKSAKLLGLPYPGGPLIDKFAKDGNSTAFTFGIPKVNKLNLSSGQGLWGKKGNGVSFKGGIISYQDLPEGILIISSYEKQMAADADLYVNILNPETGELKFDKNSSSL